MKINVFGLGYVGNVVALSLARLGHNVVGVELMPAKVKALSRGQLTLFEPGLEDLLRQSLSGKLKGSFQVRPKLSQKLFNESKATVICVGTPSLSSGMVDLGQIQSTLTEIGRMLRNKKTWHEIIIRSTIPPGTTEETLIPLLERESKKRRGKDYGVSFYPEFFREGSSLKDFHAPSLNILGCSDERSFLCVQELFRIEKNLSRGLCTKSLLKYPGRAAK